MSFQPPATPWQRPAHALSKVDIAAKEHQRPCGDGIRTKNHIVGSTH